MRREHDFVFLLTCVLHLWFQDEENKDGINVTANHNPMHHISVLLITISQSDLEGKLIHIAAALKHFYIDPKPATQPIFEIVNGEK